jgi:hypothetical protein
VGPTADTKSHSAEDPACVNGRQGIPPLSTLSYSSSQARRKLDRARAGMAVFDLDADESEPVSGLNTTMAANGSAGFVILFWQERKTQ